VSVPDPYKILQVDPEAEDEVIEAAYRRLARKYHPDVSPTRESLDRMVQINQAWELLKNPARRAAVDRARARAQGATARATAADAQARTAGYPPATVSRPGPAGPDARRVQGPLTAPRAGGGASWAFPGMSDPMTDPAQARGGADAPPGNPSGSVLNFGRYEGWSLGEIARTDLEYLEWLDRMPIGRGYQPEIDALLRAHGRRESAAVTRPSRGFFRRR
jgi:curved DNA-binding protein CbpA